MLLGVVPTAGTARRGAEAVSDRLFWFFTAVIAVQGGHMFEHVVQVLQVYAFGVPDDDALGLLGYLLQFNGTEEWLHLVFNVVYLASLYALVVPLRRLTPAVIPPWAFAVFLFGSVWLETWHVVEHGVIISHVIANGGCPCPGIADSALGVSDTIVHFFYNLISYGGVVTAYSFVLRRRQATRGPVFTGLRSRR
jgi:hypothetical protein